MTHLFVYPASTAMPMARLPEAQLLMVAGFVMLGWVLIRRQIRMRQRVNRETKSANAAIRQMRDAHDSITPLNSAPPETQRWQVALFDLQRELKADLDTRIAVVQALIRQVDERLERLASLEARVASRQPTTAIGEPSQSSQPVAPQSVAPQSTAPSSVEPPSVEQI